MPTTEAGIKTIGVSQLYVPLGDETADGAIVVRIWWKRLVTLIWIGALVMMAGGVVSLLDRRLRIGAPSRRPRLAAANPVGRQHEEIDALPCWVLAFVLWQQGVLLAVQPGEALADPVLEARARALSAELRCMVCQNQSIDIPTPNWRVTCGFWCASG